MTAVAEKTNLLGMPKAKMEAFFESLGEKRFRATQVLQWIHQRGADDFDQMTNMSRVLREKLKAVAEIRGPEVVYDESSKDGTRKWVMRMDNGNSVETVLIPDGERGTLCVSSQIGCSLDCTFCSTGKRGFNRNLTAAEIIGQVWVARKAFMPFEPGPDRPITNVVMMGMGEPLYNFDNVKQALLIVSDGEGIALSKRRITLSTSGHVPNIQRTGDEIGVGLAISLHAVHDELRNELVPINKKWNLEALLDACRNYPGVSNARRITFEYVMLKGINDSLQDAIKLVKLLKGIPAKINLIPFNPWPNSPYECSDWEQIETFAEIVNQAGYASPIRTPRGRDIFAACGQLKSESERMKKRDREALETAQSVSG